MLADHLLHAAAWTVMRLFSPQRARRAALRLGAALPALQVEEARRRHAALRRGTCLSRAIAIAARVPGAEVVIGVEPGGPVALVRAHAWVMVGQERIGETLGLDELARF